MRGVNKVIIVGNLGSDPEVKQFANGGSVTRIAVATSEQWNDKQTGERREQTEWHRISLFNKLGEIAAQYLRKGSQVYIEGSLRTNKYTDQKWRRALCHRDSCRPNANARYRRRRSRRYS